MKREYTTRNPFLDQCLNGLIWVCSRAFVWYLLLFLVSTQMVDYKRIRYISQVNELNRIKPASFKHLADLENNSVNLNPSSLVLYILFYQKIIGYFKDAVDARAMAGFCYALMGRYKVALELYSEAIQLNPHVFWFHYNQGLIYYKLNRYEEAWVSLEKAVQTNHKATLAFVRSSQIIYKSIFVEAPSVYYNLDSRLYEAYIKCFKMLILTYYRLQKYQAIINLAQKAIDQNTRERDFFHYYLGLAFYQMGRHEEAVDQFQKSVQLNPDFADAYYFLGLSVQKMGKENEGDRLIKQAQKILETKKQTKFSGEQVNFQMF